MEFADAPNQDDRHQGERSGLEATASNLTPSIPMHLRGLVRACIERHIDWRQLEVLLEAEKSERDQLAIFALKARR